MSQTTDDAPAARYAVHTAKAVETIVWLANAEPGIDIYHLVKSAFYADKEHLNRYGRPISGDDYDADTFGPLGRVIYRLIRRDPLELLALGGNGQLPFRVDGSQGWKVVADRDADMKLLSASDVECLQAGLDRVADLPFDDLVDLTHQEPAYLAANGGRMKYEDLLSRDDPHYKEKSRDLAETARYAVF